MNSLINKFIYELNCKNSDKYILYSINKINSVKKFNPVITINHNYIVCKSGLLANIPIDIKDNIVTKNILTTAGCKLLSNFIPPYNATLVQKLLDCGAHIVSKSNLEELGHGGIGENAYYGDISNPHNSKHIAGGSSSGSAVLVATGSVPIAIGSDTGDSIRRPAAYCGVIGFKPSWGRISRYGLIPYSPSLDTIGLLGRNIKDISYIYDIISGEDKKDLTTIKSNHEKSFEKLSDFTLKNKRIVFIQNIDNKIQNSEYNDKYIELKNLLQKAGCKIINKNIDDKIYLHILFTYRVLSNAESISCISNLTGLTFGKRIDGNNWKEIFRNTRSDGLSYKVKLRLLLGLYSTEKENYKTIYNYYLKVRKIIIKEYVRLFSDADAIIMPFEDFGAPLHKKFKKQNIVRGKSSYMLDNLLLANFYRSPSIMMPLGYLSSKMPISFSINCKRYEDTKLLQFANKIEKLIKFKYKLIKK